MNEARKPLINVLSNKLLKHSLNRFVSKNQIHNPYASFSYELPILDDDMEQHCNGVSEVIPNCVGFALICSVIGQENSQLVF